MIVFLRGLPGTGKTTVSNSLSEKLGWDVIHVDAFKKEYMDEHPEADFLREIVPLSYKRALAQLQNYKIKDVIVEEVFRNEDFVRDVLDFCHTNKIPYQWFKIIRNRKFLLAENTERKRAIKNTPEILDSMERKMNDIKIENEIEIDTPNMNDVVDTITHHLPTKPI